MDNLGRGTAYITDVKWYLENDTPKTQLHRQSCLWLSFYLQERMCRDWVYQKIQSVHSTKKSKQWRTCCQHATMLDEATHKVLRRLVALRKANNRKEAKPPSTPTPKNFRGMVPVFFGEKGGGYWVVGTSQSDVVSSTWCGQQHMMW